MLPSVSRRRIRSSAAKMTSRRPASERMRLPSAFKETALMAGVSRKCSLPSISKTGSKSDGFPVNPRSRESRRGITMRVGKNSREKG